jgi:hypothetical protein
MSAVKKFLSLLLCLCLLGVLSTPAFAGDRDVSVQDLKGIPKRHRFLTSIVGGAALGAGIGALLPGGANTMWKGVLIGSGAAGEWYMGNNRNAAGGWTDWAHIANGAALGAGIGWTICDCNDAAIGGLLIGGGLEGIWAASRTPRSTVATNTGRP